MKDYHVALNNTRVYVDSGSIQNNISTERVVRNLKLNNAWERCSALWLPSSLIKDGSNNVSKLYCTRCTDANNDVTQTTGSAQPVYNSDGSIYFGGTNKTLFKTLTKTQILAMTSSGDFTFQWYGKIPYAASGSINIMFSFYYNSTNYLMFRAVHYSAAHVRLNLVLAANATNVSSATPSASAYLYDVNTPIQCTFQYTASTGLFTGFVNNTNLGIGSTLGNVNDISDQTFTSSFARTSTTYNINTMYGAAMFRGILTPQQCKLEV